MALVCSLTNAYTKEEGPVDTESFDRTVYEDLKNNRDYNYYLNQNPDKINLWDQFVNWLAKSFLKLVRLPFVGYFFRILPYLLIAGTVFLILMQVMKLNPSVIFKKHKKIQEKPFIVYEEDINRIDIDTLLKNAIFSLQYRLAVRYYFLKFLKILSDRGEIQWKMHKSNIEYLHELRDERLRDKFKAFAYDYECIWYGEYKIDEQIYKGIEKAYIETMGEL